MKRPSKPVGAGTNIRPYACSFANDLLGRLAFQFRRAANEGDDEAIHDLRTSIRRFSRCLAAFGQFFSRAEVRRIRKQLRKCMKLAGEIRNRDIALALMKNAGISSRSALAQELREQRRQGHAALASLLARRTHKDFSLKWRQRLQIG